MEHDRILKLLLIYNADSGLRTAILDGMHKIVSPGTYDCKLCEITFGIFTENTDWKKFRESFHLEMEFLHKDEFTRQYASKFGHKFTYPIILGLTQNGLEVFVSTEELNALQKADDLIGLIEKRAFI